MEQMTKEIERVEDWEDAGKTIQDSTEDSSCLKREEVREAQTEEEFQTILQLDSGSKNTFLLEIA